MSCGSGQANLGQLRTLSRSEQPIQTSLADVAGRICLRVSRFLEEFSSECGASGQVGVRFRWRNGERLRMLAQETWRFGD